MKVIITGDSISQGIGNKKVNYCDILKKDMPNIDFINLALTGTTVNYCEKNLPDIISMNPEYVVIFYGNVDALPRVRTDTKIYKYLPKRYKRLGMFDPRALYTSRKFVRLIQKIDSNFRYRLKNMLIYFQGYEQWTPLEEFKEKYDRIIYTLLKNDIKVICLTTVPMSEKYFPNANKEYARYNTVIQEISSKYSVEFIDIYHYLLKYNPKEIFLHDLYHPNYQGYEILASLIEEKLKSE